jgi:hypothetical protein
MQFFSELLLKLEVINVAQVESFCLDVMIFDTRRNQRYPAISREPKRN